MRTALIGLIGLIALASPAAAWAQGIDSPWETGLDTNATLVLGAPVSDEARAPDFQTSLWEASLGARAERTLSSGITIGGRIALRAQRDNPARPGGAGDLAEAAMRAPAGAVSRLSVGPDAGNTGSRGSLESAYVFVETGYGEVSVGRDTGIAARFHEGDVGVMSRARLVDPYLDPSGLAAISTRADITGPSAKISYVTPRLLGVRAGASFTPKAEARGLDKDPTISESRLRPGLESIAEFGVQASRRLRDSGVRLRAGLSWSTGELEAPANGAALFDDRVSVTAAGGEVEWDDRWRFGLNWLSADEGLASGGDYTAWSAGLAYAGEDWRAAILYGHAGIDAIGASSDGVSFEIGRAISDQVELALAWRDLSVDFDPGFGSAPGSPHPQSRGVVLEITLRGEN